VAVAARRKSARMMTKTTRRSRFSEELPGGEI
jgi:hypothetical protein